MSEPKEVVSYWWISAKTHHKDKKFIACRYNLGTWEIVERREDGQILQRIEIESASTMDQLVEAWIELRRKAASK